MSRAPKIKIPPEAKRFVECARRYCALVGEHEKTPIRELLAALHVLLPELYARGVALPDIESSDDLFRRDRKHNLRSWTKVRNGLYRRLGRRTHYMQIFDAYDRLDRGSTVGLLCVDFADIYVDVAEGLRIWDAGDRADAVYQWRWSAKHHWGGHAVAAIAALHWLRENHDYGPPPPMPSDKTRKLAATVTRSRKV